MTGMLTAAPADSGDGDHRTGRRRPQRHSRRDDRHRIGARVADATAGGVVIEAVEPDKGVPAGMAAELSSQLKRAALGYCADRATMPA